MKIAILSGKGGTGKTLIAVNLAQVTDRAAYVDCDVEEPNGHLFFKPKDITTEKVIVQIPEVDNQLCNGCRQCVDFCNFNALAYINKLIIFEDICHSCGGCVILCPKKALTEKEKTIGVVEKGLSADVRVLTGILNTGEASGVPIIKALLRNEDELGAITFIDCPPGSSCIVMESIQDADYCILVAEPTLFGVHNLNMVYELVKLFDKPHGVVLNKCLKGRNPAEEFCQEKGIQVLAKLPFDHDLGLINSRAQIVAEESPHYRRIFITLLEKVLEEVQNETTSNS